MAEPANDGAIVAVQGSEEPQSGAIVVSSEVRLAGVDLNEIKKLVTQTKAIGVILPPPDIRAIVDKTASFVAKHGEYGDLSISSVLRCPPLCLICVLYQNRFQAIDPLVFGRRVGV